MFFFIDNLLIFIKDFLAIFDFLKRINSFENLIKT